MLLVVKNTKGLKNKVTGKVNDYITSRVFGVERPICADERQIGPHERKLLDRLGEVIEKPEGLDTNPWPLPMPSIVTK